MMYKFILGNKKKISNKAIGGDWCLRSFVRVGWCLQRFLPLGTDVSSRLVPTRNYTEKFCVFCKSCVPCSIVSISHM
jgi:hypothetical protein